MTNQLKVGDIVRVRCGVNIITNSPSLLEVEVTEILKESGHQYRATLGGKFPAHTHSFYFSDKDIVSEDEQIAS